MNAIFNFEFNTNVNAKITALLSKYCCSKLADVLLISK